LPVHCTLAPLHGHPLTPSCAPHLSFPPSTGELWTRDWDKLPLPDLAQRPEEAAALISELAAINTQTEATPILATGPADWVHKAREAAQRREGAVELQVKQQQVQRGGVKVRKRALRESPPSSGGEEETAWSRSERVKRDRRAGRFGDGAAEGAAKK
jgi:hypothetical protein